MDDKYTKKLTEREATSRSRLAAIRQVDGRDTQIDQRLNRDGSTVMEGPVQLPGTGRETPDEEHHAAPAGWVADEVADAKQDAIQKVTEHRNGSPHFSENQIRGMLPNETGGIKDGSALANHSHSISFTPFIKLSRDERLGMLDDRLDNMVVANSPTATGVERVIAKNVENLLSLLMDYRQMDAYERELRLSDPEFSSWADLYKRAYGVDEYARDDVETYVEHNGVKQHPYEGISDT
jgi:hypothetical protein